MSKLYRVHGLTVQHGNRIYVQQYGDFWSFPIDGYGQLLRDVCQGDGYNLDDPKYRARRVKRLPTNTWAADVLDWNLEIFEEELASFVKHFE